MKISPKAVIFDLGSTLIEYPSTDWEKLSVRCLGDARKWLARKGHKLPGEKEFLAAFAEVREEYRSIAEKTMKEWTVPQVVEGILKKHGIMVDESTAENFFDVYYKPIQEKLYVYDDTESTLESIKQTGTTIGLISNTIFPERTHLGELKRFGIDGYFDFTIFSSTFGLRKPHPDLFYKAANMAGQAPGDCVYIGDRFREDVEGPRGVGMKAVLKRHDEREYPDEIPEDVYQIDTLGQLLEYLDI